MTRRDSVAEDARRSNQYRTHDDRFRSASPPTHSSMRRRVARPRRDPTIDGRKQRSTDIRRPARQAGGGARPPGKSGTDEGQVPIRTALATSSTPRPDSRHQVKHANRENSLLSIAWRSVMSVSSRTRRPPVGADSGRPGNPPEHSRLPIRPSGEQCIQHHRSLLDSPTNRRAGTTDTWRRVAA